MDCVPLVDFWRAHPLPPIIIHRNTIVGTGDSDENFTGIHWDNLGLPDIGRQNRVISTNVIRLKQPTKQASWANGRADNTAVIDDIIDLGQNGGMNKRPLADQEPSNRCHGIEFVSGSVDIFQNTIDIRSCKDITSRAIHTGLQSEAENEAGVRATIAPLPKIFNNILMGKTCPIGNNGGEVRGTNNVHHNLFFYPWLNPPNPDIMEGCVGIPAGQNNLTIIPNEVSGTFVNTGSRNYHLESGAKAINAGSDDTNRYKNLLGDPIKDLDAIDRPVENVYDLGAYEFLTP